MSRYVQQTDFTEKDNLPSGDPQKIILGRLFDAEFDAIARAFDQLDESIEDRNEEVDVQLTTLDSRTQAATSNRAGIVQLSNGWTGLNDASQTRAATPRDVEQRIQTYTSGNLLQARTRRLGTTREQVNGSADTLNYVPPGFWIDFTPVQSNSWLEVSFNIQAWIWLNDTNIPRPSRYAVLRIEEVRGSDVYTMREIDFGTYAIPTSDSTYQYQFHQNVSFAIPSDSAGSGTAQRRYRVRVYRLFEGLTMRFGNPWYDGFPGPENVVRPLTSNVTVLEFAP